MKVYLTNFTQNTADHPSLRGSVVYGELFACDDDSLVLSATLEYIAEAIRDRGYVVECIGAVQVRHRV